MRLDAAQTWPVSRLVLAALLSLSLSPGLQAESLSAKRAAAKVQFQRAEKERTELLGRGRDGRTADEYLKVIAAYRRVALLTPRAAEVPQAYVAVAELYREMGRLFENQYFESAVESYQTLLQRYPKSRYREDAILSVGNIQKDDLERVEDAEKTFRGFLKEYEHSPKAKQARGALEEISDFRRGARNARTLARDREKARHLPQVTQIRTWNGDNYTRIVIDVQDQVKYQASRIHNPDRIYFDLQKARLSPPLLGKTVEVNGTFLKNIRVAQNQAGVVRVVLDVDKVKDYSVFLLPDPYRLVVDVYGHPPPTVKAELPAAPDKMPAREIAKAAPPAAPPGTENSDPANAKHEKTSGKHAEHAPPGPEKPITTVTVLAGDEPDKPPVEPARSPKAERSRAAKATREAASKMTPPSVPKYTHDGQLPLTRALGLKIGRIVIDPGHGGHDTGTIGPTGLMEKDLCLDVALRLGKIIRQRLPGAEVVYTREDDTFISLESRTIVANQAKADLFISIHANSSRDHGTRGVETYYLNFSPSAEAMEVASRENALAQGSIHDLQEIVNKIARNEKVEESRELATDIQDSLAKRMKTVNRTLKDRGVRKAPFVVLIGANMPSVLSEISFISNPADEQMLKKPENRQRVAEGLFHGVESYLQSINSLSYYPPRADGHGRAAVVARSGKQR